MAKKAHRVGAYSSNSALTHLDLRTREGKFLQAVHRELTEQVGEAPTAAEQILIKLATLKVLRVSLMADAIMSSEAIDERRDRQFLAWANSLRRDLDVLGITRRAKSSPRLAELLGHRAA